MRIIISDSQQICRDCLEPAPKIDLTLRTNGEQQVSVIDSLGNVIRAGFEAPTVVPTSVDGTTTGVDWLFGTLFAAATKVYWQYLYVYVAKTKYPLVENAVTGNGSAAPRSNPSPQLATPEDNSGASSNKTRILSITPSQRNDISHIWIYRTPVTDTADKANNSSEGGIANWIGEIVNNPNLATLPFEDLGPTNAPAKEQIEQDNFLALNAKYCKFDGTYFWCIGNDVRTEEIIVDATGYVLKDNTSPWFNGRDAQIATFDGITSGGFDNHGSFYIKITSPTEAQLYLDLGLTTTTGTSTTGTTQIHLRGLATTLFRSKIRNPFSWGYTDQIGNILVPTPYNFSLGGGRATSLQIVPDVNLLKIDVEAPSLTFTLNLKAAGTPNFEPSLRPISSSYVVSINDTQFPATVNRGQTQLWGLDTKTFSIVSCDGTSQVPVSDFVTKTMHEMIITEADRLSFHGGYLSRLELNLIFFRKNGTEGEINQAIWNHWPTGYWGILDVLDVSASCMMVNPFTHQSELIVGNSVGFIGIFGSDTQSQNWAPNRSCGQLTTDASLPGEILIDANLVSLPFGFEGIIGNFMFIWDEMTLPNKLLNFRWAKILDIFLSGHFFIVTLDIPFSRDFVTLNPISYPFPYGGGPTYFSIGAIEMQLGRFFNAQIPFSSKQIEEVLTTMSFTAQLRDFFPSVIFGADYLWSYEQLGQPSSSVVENPLKIKELTSPERNPSLPTIFARQGAIPVDQTAVFGIMISDRNQCPATVFNYQINVAVT